MWAKGGASQDSVVSFCTFTIKVCLICVLKVTAGYKELCSLWARQVLISCTDTTTTICDLRGQQAPEYVDSGGSRTLSSSLVVEN
jgi:hypothetical protein